MNNKEEVKFWFKEFATKWRKETVNESSNMYMHPAYQKIIGMGPKVVPLLIEECKKNPDWWFWALEAITWENPVRKKDRGRLPKMAASWVRWWERQQKIHSAWNVRLGRLR